MLTHGKLFVRQFVVKLQHLLSYCSNSKSEEKANGNVEDQICDI